MLRVESLPTTDQAESWDTEDIFTYHGHKYRLNPDFTVSRVNGDYPPTKKAAES